MSAQVDYATLLREIKQRLADHMKGTMFITTSEKRSFTVAFQDGVITGVSSGLTVGNEAVESLRKVNFASYRFSPTLFNPPGSTPEPSHISLLLGTDPPQTAVVSPAGQGPDFKRRSLDVIENNLLEALGPFAAFLMDDARKAVSREHGGMIDLDNLLSTLAREIDDKKKAEEFIQKTKSDLGV